ncbi:hypothetical protein GCM10027610_068050 [Dactylosporangium cerinum]
MHGQRAGGLRGQPDPGGLGDGEVRDPGRLDEVGQVEGAAAIRQVPRLGERQVLQVVQDAPLQHRLVVQRAEQVPARRDEAVLQRLQVAEQVRQRRAQLVGDAGDQPALRLLRRFEGRRHPVERRRQLPELVPADGGHPRVEVPVGEAPGRGGEVAHRPAHVPGDDRRAENDQNEHTTGGDEPGPADDVRRVVGDGPQVELQRLRRERADPLPERPRQARRRFLLAAAADDVRHVVRLLQADGLRDLLAAAAVVAAGTLADRDAIAVGGQRRRWLEQVGEAAGEQDGLPELGDVLQGHRLELVADLRRVAGRHGPGDLVGREGEPRARVHEGGRGDDLPGGAPGEVIAVDGHLAVEVRQADPLLVVGRQALHHRVDPGPGAVVQCVGAERLDGAGLAAGRGLVRVDDLPGGELDAEPGGDADCGARDQQHQPEHPESEAHAVTSAALRRRPEPRLSL